MSVRVRFAPSPTGALHIGGIRTALFNYLLAKKHGGTFLLRIEDTDQTRFVEGAEQYIINALQWCGIAPTEGIGFGEGKFAPYRQSERKHLYHQYAQELLKNGKAYIAFDTPEELETMRERLKSETNQSYSWASRMTMRNSLTLSETETTTLLAANTPHVIRLKIEPNETVTLHDLIRGKVEVKTNELDDKVLMKADGMPTYHLANIVDDYLMQITHVIRGEEWLPSAAHHVLIYKALGWETAMPQFAHLPLILKPDGKGKLSKRDGAKFGFPVFPLGWQGATSEDSFKGFQDAGFDPRAVVNFLALLGWSSGDEQEVFSLEELTERFSLEKINKAGARFDYDKAKWFNQQYIMATDSSVIAESLRSQIEAQFDINYITRFVDLMKERVVFLSDFLVKGSYFFHAVIDYDQATLAKKWKAENRPFFEKLIIFLEKDANFNTHSDLEHSVKDFINQNAMKIGDVLPILRIALMGTMQGAGLFEVMQLFGITETCQRIRIGIEKF